MTMTVSDLVFGPICRDLDPADRALQLEEWIVEQAAREARIEELEGEAGDYSELKEDFEKLEKERDELQEEVDERTKERDDIDGKLADARIEIERLTAERVIVETGESAETGALRDALAGLLSAIDAAKLGKVARVGSLVIVETAERTMGQMGGSLGAAIARAREVLA